MYSWETRARRCITIYRCPFCGYVATRRRDLTQHLSGCVGNLLMGEWSRCPVCGKKMTPRGLPIHAYRMAMRGDKLHAALYIGLLGFRPNTTKMRNKRRAAALLAEEWCTSHEQPSPYPVEVESSVEAATDITLFSGDALYK